MYIQKPNKLVFNDSELRYYVRSFVRLSSVTNYLARFVRFVSVSYSYISNRFVRVFSSFRF